MNRRDLHYSQSNITFVLILFLSLIGKSTYAQEKYSKIQKDSSTHTMGEQWETVFNQSLCTTQADAWKTLFFLDGLNGKVTDTQYELSFEAGHGGFFHADHSVLWTKQTFKDGLKISYDYRRDDSITKDEVCILYLLAEGIGQSPFKQDIERWSELRRIPYMYIYFWGMRLAHISYSTGSAEGSPYIRCRTYPMETNKTVWSKLVIASSYDDPGFFKPHKWYHIEVYKNRKQLSFHVTGEGLDKTFSWENKRLGQIKSGRIGFRQMQGRNSSYKNLCIRQLKK